MIIVSFYQAMQLGAANLKPLIKNTQDKTLKQKYITAFILKNFLCLLFCIFVVVSFSCPVDQTDCVIVGLIGEKFPIQGDIRPHHFPADRA